MDNLTERLRRPGMLHSNPEQTNAERREAADEIERLKKNLNGRDDFLVKIGQWQAFVDQLPREIDQKPSIDEIVDNWNEPIEQIGDQ